AQILEEHAFLLNLQESEVPVVAPRKLIDGKTLHKLPDCEIYYAVFPKVGGRSPQELNFDDVEQIGRLLGRLHNVGATMHSNQRIHLQPSIFFNQNFQYLLHENMIPEARRHDFTDLLYRLDMIAKRQFSQVDQIQIHGDCHLGNLLQSGQHFFWVDFDDSMIGPAVQDIWLLLPGRDHHAQQLLQHLLEAYEQMRPFPWASLRLIETLRAMRMVHFAAWIAHRRDDPAFQKAFPEYGTDQYWQQLYYDLLDQEQWMNKEHAWPIARFN
ncbi:MAG: serine/threonine protein kinase, partial [Proteobacteria bacterium]|nr:serine/threonine protein kinase [Pseudomonadota bacterium]